MLHDDAGVFKAVLGVHLDGEGLPERCLEAVELLSVGREHFAVAVGIAHGAVVAVHVEENVHNVAAVGGDEVGGVGVAAGVCAVPVHLGAEAVNALGEVGGNGERGRVDFVAAIAGDGYAVRVLSRLVFAVERIGHQFAVLGARVVVVHLSLELTVAVAVDIYIAVHPTARVGEIRSNGLAGLCVEHLFGHVIVDALGRGGQREGYGRLAVGFKRERVEPAVVARSCLSLVEVHGIRLVGDARGGVGVDFNLVDIAHLVGRVGVRRFAVGHDDEASYVDASVALNGEHYFLPAVGGHVGSGHCPELLRVGRLPGAVAALAETHYHDAAGVGAVDEQVDILGRGREFEGLFQIDAHAEGVAAEARTLHGKDFSGGVGGRAKDFLNLIEVVVDNGVVALQRAGAEGRGFPSVVDSERGIVLSVESNGLSQGRQGQECRECHYMLEFHGCCFFER